MSRRLRTIVAFLLASMTAITGCTPSKPIYLFDDGDMSHYKGMATEIEYPDIETVKLDDVLNAKAPLTLSNPEAREIWDLTLEEAMRTALANSKVLRNLGGLLFTPGLPASNQTIAPTGQLLQTQGQNLSGQALGQPQTAQTIYNPAIQESNTSNGVEAALSQFDAQFNSQMFWQKNDRPQNLFFNGFTPPVFIQDFAQFQAEIGKVTADGSRVFVRNHQIYDQNNNRSNQFPSSFNTDLEAEFRHPLLQGAGVEFNRIAGPNSSNGLIAGQATNTSFLNPNTIPGNYNGVVLARINVDITLADFEAGVRNMVSDVERAYWDLYYNYRNLAAVQAGRDSALQTWRKVYALYVAGSKGGEAEKEAQAREQYFLFRAQVENSLGLLYTAESRLRYMMGLAPTDGRLIRPADEPTTAEVQFAWHEILPEGLTRSVEIRRQKWIVRQNELKLQASRNYLLPRLDMQALYRWRGFGDQLVNYQGQAFNANAVGTGANNGSGAWNTLWGGQYQEWQLGLNLTVPIGFRLAMAGVRNAELVLAQSRALLQDQELELVHVLTNSIRDLDRNYQVSQTTFNRRVAAAKQVEAVKAGYDAGTVTLDMLLDAQRRLADAEIAYYRALVDYNVAILQVHFRKNSLLEYNGVYLAEGPWPAKAYFDARKRARERDAAMFVDYGFTRPQVFSRGLWPQTLNQPGEPFEKSELSAEELSQDRFGEGPNASEPEAEPNGAPQFDLEAPSEGQPGETPQAPPAIEPQPQESTGPVFAPPASQPDEQAFGPALSSAPAEPKRSNSGLSYPNLTPADRPRNSGVLRVSDQAAPAVNQLRSSGGRSAMRAPMTGGEWRGARR
ncbi:MAG TPA: TolC family protein [Pirellulales bacterium]|nr:TolC family protein [Pirellulales bacterium]